MVEAGVAGALCQALSLRVSNAGSPRVYEAAALAGGVLASNVATSPKHVEQLRDLPDALCKVCAHCMRHVHVLSRRDRGSGSMAHERMPHGALHHKQLIAASRVVASTGVAVFILRDLAQSVANLRPAEGASKDTVWDIFASKDTIWDVFNHLQLQVVSHMLHALKGGDFFGGFYGFFLVLIWKKIEKKMRGHDVYIVCRRLWLQGVKAAVFFIAAIITELVCGCVNMRVYIHCVCGCGHGCGYVGVGFSCYI